MNINLYLIKALFIYNIYKEYNIYINESFIKDNNKELFKLLQVIHVFHRDFPEKDITSLEEFEAFYLSQYPTSNPKDLENLQGLLRKLQGIEIRPEIAQGIFQAHNEQTKATELSLIGLEVAEGKRPYQDLVEATQKLSELRSTRSRANDFASNDLREINKRLYGENGLNWRLKSLNSRLGPLRKGNFGFVIARPETGKTTFLASELTHMVRQVEKPIIWFNNEQPNDEVIHRIYQGYFGVKSYVLKEKEEKFSEIYLKETANRLLLFGQDSFGRRDVDDVCSYYDPSLIVFDQLDKVSGFTDDRNDLELTKKYQWARILARQYGPVIGICQARVTADNKQYLDMSDAADSQTGKQGEADWILGIGKNNQPGLEHIRFLHLSKNKLLGGPATNESLRHDKWQVRMFPDIARYEDI